MSNKIPIFPISEPQHFSDYGFDDPQIHYFQVLEEARRHKIKETPRSTTAIDIQHFKLQKPISRSDESSKKIKKNNKKKKKHWWKNALQFFKIKSQKQSNQNPEFVLDNNHYYQEKGGIRGSSISGPVYITDSSGSSTPYRTTSRIRHSSGPLVGSLSPAQKGEMGIPYISLRDINIEPQQYHRMSTSAMPIYLVT